MANEVKWRDIVLINGKCYLEEFPIELETGFDKIQFGNTMEEILKQLNNFNIISLYNCDNFFDAVREKYDLSPNDDISTYLFNEDDFNENIPDDVFKKYDIALLGGYINGINI